MRRDVLRVAVVGLGFSRFVMPEYARAKETELALLCDLDEARCEEHSKEYGVPWTTTFEDCLGEGIDMVDISTPNDLHVPQALAALEAGKHVLMQKPMARSAEECLKVVEKGKESGLAVGMYMSSLNQPVMHEVKAMIADGALGQVTSLRARTAHRNMRASHELRPDDHWRRDKSRVGGGGMALIGIHMIHLVQWLAGQGIESVMAESANLACEDIMTGDDTTVAACRFGNGAMAVVEASYATEGRGLEIYGTKGYVQMGRADGTLTVKTDKPWKGKGIELPGGEHALTLTQKDIEACTGHFRDEYEQHAAFARAVLAGTQVPAPGAEGMRDVAVLEAIYRSAETGRREVIGHPPSLG